MNSRTVENHQTLKEKYSELFEAQLDFLRNCGLNEAQCQRLGWRKLEVIETAIKLNIPSGVYPFIPNVEEPLTWHLRRVISGGSSVKILSDISVITDNIKVAPFSFTYGIDDGYCVRYLTFDQTIEEIKKRRGSPLTFKEMAMYRILTYREETRFGYSVSEEITALGSVIRISDKSYTPDFYRGSNYLETITDVLTIPGKEGRSAPFCLHRY
jgi:hypothetical protein